MERMQRPRLAFVSPQFLFPNDAGGKIRTTNILRGLKGGAFELVLLSVASPEQEVRWKKQLDGVCDEFIAWAPKTRAKWRRALDLMDDLPVNVVMDRTEAGVHAVAELVARTDIDLVVFDFVHSAVLLPPSLPIASVCFTHNVEAEIFSRHASQATDVFRRALWATQHRKMQRFEGRALARFDTVIAVSERDAKQFGLNYQIEEARPIPTGVDLDFFHWSPAPEISELVVPTVVFTGSMDWAANIDGIRFFLQQVWPRILASMPQARFKVVGKSPPASLQALAAHTRNVQFTGFVDDVRPHVHEAHVFVIPLLVGGGTRIKAFEAMAMGCPVVSTTIGIEGLGAEPDVHYLCRDESDAMAAGVLELLGNSELRRNISSQARQLVEQRFGHQSVARVFEQICLDTLARRTVAQTLRMQ